MADNYPVAIQVDARSVAPTARAAAAELGNVELAGVRAGQAVSRGMREGAEGTDRARDAMGRFAGSARVGSSAADGAARSAVGLARAFEGVAHAIQREQQMLDRINGPLRRYEEELQTLDSLQRRGAITTEQYANQVARLNRELERHNALGGSSSPRAPAPPAVAKPSGILASAGAASGALATVGLALGAAEATRYAFRLADSYQVLQNRLRAVAGASESVNEFFARTRTVATATRSSVETTTEAFVRLKGATKELGLTNEQVFTLTARINKAISLSGASSAEASAGMMQLAQALAAGRLQGDEFRSVMENLPYVADVLARSLGVTRGKLRELAEQGKLTSSVVVAAFTQAGAQIDKDFAKTVPTLSQQWTVFQDTLMIAVGKVVSATKIFERLGEILGFVGDAFDFVGELSEGFELLVKELGAFGEVLANIPTPLGLLRDGLSLLGDGIEFLSEKISANEIAARKQAESYLANREALKLLIAEELKLERAHRLMTAARDAGIAAPTFDLEAAKRAAAFRQTVQRGWGIDIPNAFDTATAKALEFDAQLQKIKQQRAIDEQAEQVKRLNKELNRADDLLASHSKRYRDAADKVKDAEKNLQLLLQERAANEIIDIGDPSYKPKLPITRFEAEAVRDLGRAQIELTGLGSRYGEMVADIKLKTYEHRNALVDVHGAYRDGEITLKEYTDKLRELGVEEDKATQILRGLREPLKDWERTIGALNQLLKQGLIDAQQYNDELLKLVSSQPARTGTPPRYSAVGGRNIGGLEVAIGVDTTAEIPRAAPPSLEALGIGDSIDTKWMEDLIERARKAGGVLEAASLKTAHWNSELERLQRIAQLDGFSRGFNTIKTEITDVAGALETTLVNAFHGVEQAIVDLAATGQFSFRRMIDAMIADLTRLLIRQAVASLISSIAGGGTPSFFGTGASQAFTGKFGGAKAYGGEYRVGGSGGPDSQLVAFRLTPGEHVQFTPPGERPVARAEKAPPPKVTIVNVYDRGEMRKFMEDEGEGYILNVLHRNEPALRGRLSGR